MIHTRFQSVGGKRWHTDGRFAVTGSLFHRGRRFAAEALGELVAGADFRRDWAGSLRQANGFFALVHRDEESVRAAVDRIRGFPLFYAARGQDLFLSDDADWVRRQAGQDLMDDVAVWEFQEAGYVTGPETLFGGVRQLQAGECMTAAQGPDGWSIRTERYYRYLHRDCLAEDTPGLLDRHDEVIAGATRRMVEHIAGRTAVVPLSGGYDSRLVALMLKRADYDKVICFSYGRPGSDEAARSKAAAEGMGLPWLFIPYSDEAWRRWDASDDRRSYTRYAHGLSALPHYQDWPAVADLKRQGAMPDDAVFLPGHSGDFLAGSHIPKHASLIRKGGVDDAVGAIREVHYRYLRNLRRPDGDLDRRVDAKIARLVGELPAGMPLEALDACESWDWQERQAKYIGNSVRVYEFLGYDWWLPLWDAELLAFWERIPVRRNGTSLYDSYVLRAGERYGLRPKPPTVSETRGRIKAILKALGLLEALRPRENRKRRRTNHFAFPGVVPPEKWRSLQRGMSPFMTYWMQEALAEIRADCDSS